MRPILDWLHAMFGHWQGWASGGGLGGLALILINIAERLLGKTFMSKQWYVVLFFVLFVLGASFMTWKDLRDRLADSTNTLDELTQPRFEVTFLQAIISDDRDDPASSNALLVVRLNNLGQDSAVPEDTWALSASTPDGKTYQARVTMLSPGDNDYALPEGIRRFVATDALYERASRVIKKDSYVIGVITGSFRGLLQKTLTAESTTLELRAKTIRGGDIVGTVTLGYLKDHTKSVALPSLAYPVLIIKATK